MMNIKVVNEKSLCFGAKFNSKAICIIKSFSFFAIAFKGKTLKYCKKYAFDGEPVLFSLTMYNTYLTIS